MKLRKTKIHNQSRNNHTNCNLSGNHFVSVVFKNYNILSLFIISRDKRKAQLYYHGVLLPLYQSNIFFGNLSPSKCTKTPRQWHPIWFCLSDFQVYVLRKSKAQGGRTKRSSFGHGLWVFNCQCRPP